VDRGVLPTGQRTDRKKLRDGAAPPGQRPADRGRKTLAEANQYSAADFIPWWNRILAVQPNEAEDAHRPLEQGHDLDAVLSYVETRKVKADYSFQFKARQYVIERVGIRTGVRRADLRIEKLRDGTIAVRFDNHYLSYQSCDRRPKVEPDEPATEKKRQVKPRATESSWINGFLDNTGPLPGQAIALSNATG